MVQDTLSQFAQAFGQPEPLAPEPVAAVELAPDVMRRASGVSAFGRELGRPEKLGFTDAMAELWDEPTKAVPFVGGVKQAFDAGRLWEAARDIERGVATEEQQEEVARFLWDARKRQGVGYIAGSILSELPAFAGEFAATGGLYAAGRKGARKLAAAALRETVESVAEKGVKRAAVGAAGLVGGAAAQTLAMPHRVIASTFSRALPAMGLDDADPQRTAIVFSTSTAGFLDALPAGAADAWIEMLSERTGAAIPRAIGAPTLQATLMQQWLRVNPGKTADDFLGRLGDAAGWHGVLGEMFEERVGEGLRSLILGDEYELPGLDQLAGEALALSVPGAVAAGVRAAQGRGTPEQPGPRVAGAEEAVPSAVEPGEPSRVGGEPGRPSTPRNALERVRAMPTPSAEETQERQSRELDELRGAVEREERSVQNRRLETLTILDQLRGREAEAPELDLETATRAELRDEAERLGLDTTGSRLKLRERIGGYQGRLKDAIETVEREERDLAAALERLRAKYPHDRGRQPGAAEGRVVSEGAEPGGPPLPDGPRAPVVAAEIPEKVGREKPTGVPQEGAARRAREPAPTPKETPVEAVTPAAEAQEARAPLDLDTASYREIQSEAKRLGEPAKGTRKKLVARIRQARERGEVQAQAIVQESGEPGSVRKVSGSAPEVPAPSAAEPAYSITNPFAEKAKKAREKADRLNRPTASEQAMGKAFPLGAGFGQKSLGARGRAKRIDASVNRAVAAVEAEKRARYLEAQAQAYERGEIDAQGRRVTKESRARSEKRQSAKEKRDARVEAAKVAIEGKERWQVRGETWADAAGYLGGSGRALVLSDHRGYVEKALAEGKPVPAEVIADYPDLASAAEPTELFAGGPSPINISEGLVKKAWMDLRRWAKRNLTPPGDLPGVVFDYNIERQDWINARANEMEYATRDLKRAVRSEYGEKLSTAQLARINQVLAGGTAESLPEGVRDAVLAMRDQIDRMSRTLIRWGVVEGDLALKIDANMGFYVTRSYQAFDDPRWAEKVPELVRNRFKALLRAEHAKRLQKRREVWEKRAELARARAELHGEETKARAKQEALAEKYEARANEPQPVLTDEQIETQIETLLFEGKAADSPIAIIARGGKLGAKDLSTLKRRQMLTPEYRALLGQYTDPFLNFGRSVMKMAYLAANHRFLSQVREAGLGEFFFEESDPARPATHKAKIAADASSVMFPLNGLYTTPEIRTAFERAMEGSKLPDNIRWWLAAWYKLNGVTKFGKVVLNPATVARNFSGNIGFALFNGNFALADIAKAARALLGQHGKNREEFRRYVTHAIDVGVLHESVHAGEIYDVLQDAGVQPTEQFIDSWYKKALRTATDKATRLYQAMDDVWKLYNWEQEKKRYAGVYEGRALDEHAAKIVRATHPTYSLVPQAIKNLRRFPFLVPFASFNAEVVRTAWNTIKLTREEMRSKDARVRRSGHQRLVGMLTWTAIPIAATTAARFLFGVGLDDDDDARELVAPWSRNNELLWLGENERGNRTYVDTSFTNPHSYLREPILALLRGARQGDLEQSMREAGLAMMEPWIQGEIFTTAAAEALVGHMLDGREVDDPIAHVVDTMKPGFIDQAERIKKAATGEVSASGKRYSMALEALGLFGVRVSELDVAQSLSYRAGDYQREVESAERRFRRVLTGRGTTTREEVRAAYDESEAERLELFERMRRTVSASGRLGLSDQELRAALDSGGFSLRDVSDLLTGRYAPYRPSSQLRTSLRERVGEQEARWRWEEAMNLTRGRTAVR